MMSLSGALGFSQIAIAALASAVWQGVLLALVAWAGLKLLPRTPAAVRFAVWFSVFVVVSVLPAVSILTGTTWAGRHTAEASALLTLDSRWCLAIASVWMIASLVKASTLVASAVRVRVLWKRSEPVALPGADVLRSVGGRQAQVCVSDEVDRPSVIGFFAPKILIPRWLLHQLTADELHQIVLHEIGHLGRADDWLNLLQKLALVVFPLNPALVWVERRLCFERELACDERVLQETNAPKAYAACLAALAEFRMGRRSGPLSIGALGRESELGQRVGRILADGSRMRPAQARLVLGSAMLVLAAGTVELSRAPQVVAFNSAPPVKAAVMGKASGFVYQEVVYHPDASPRSIGIAQQSKAHSHSTASHPGSYLQTGRPLDKVGIGNRTLGVPVAKVVRARYSHYVGHPQELYQQQLTRTEWLMVSTWSSSDGSRAGMTSTGIHASDVPRAFTGSEPAEQDQVHPYAAVPVRGGWLVFQL